MVMEKKTIKNNVKNSKIQREKNEEIMIIETTTHKYLWNMAISMFREKL